MRVRQILSWEIVPLFTLLLTGCGGGTGEKQGAYPHTRKSDHVDVYHSQEVKDPYRWLEDDNSKETGEWVSTQNVLTRDYLDNIPYRNKIKERLETLYNYERVSAPFREGNFEYFYKNSGLQNHSVLYRSAIGSDASAEVFLDPNTFSADGTVALRGVSFTKDGSLAGYMISEGGADWRKIIVVDTKMKGIIGDTLIDVKFSGLSWKGNKGFFYSRYIHPESGSLLSGKTEYHSLFYHELGTSQREDVLVYGGVENPNRYVGGYVTDDEQYLVISAAQNTSGNQLYIKSLQGGESPPIQLQDDYYAECRAVDNDGTTFFLYTNIDAPKSRLVSVDLNDPRESAWENIIPESENVLRINSGGGKFFANYLIDARTKVHQYSYDGTLEREIELPGIGTAYGFDGKKEEEELYFSFTSFTYPTTIFKYSVSSGETTVYRSPDIDFVPSNYVSQQVFFPSKDGTRIPMFIVHKKELVLNGKNPTMLYAYGGFNISLTPRFNVLNLVWLENGGIYAQPNLRGGGEYGEAWHRAGTKMNKQNVFDDFIAAAEFLIDNNYTSSDYLGISGGSNGGLLVGATMTQRPDLMKVALPAVGVMDMLRYHQFTAGAGWADDYGTADDSPEMFEYLRKYSPLHALRENTLYPATLVTTADHDDRVVPAHSFKYAARLQAVNAGHNPTLIRIQTRAGHGSVSTEQRLELAADRFAFVWKNMNFVPEHLIQFHDSAN
ncbi:MAG: prolyl oligopeptidase family serine peptidase [Candidatus Neomarinimicrobiota bacterium]|nr:prolyl oligopeptidase family serine peptidase [Candidatus Neomarinimicrobiota bacterium]